MERLTRMLNNEFYIVDDDKVNCDDNGCSGEAITRLARFESIYDDLVVGQSKISEELEKLRNEGKTKSVRFRELMVKKMTNSNIIILFKTYGLQ
jgi:hypothetical protein